MKKPLITAVISIIIFIGCNPKMEKQNPIKTTVNQSSFYDLFYLDILSRGKTPMIKNIDSLNEIGNIKNYLILLKENTGIDSLGMKRIDVGNKISISDSLKTVLKGKFISNSNKSGVTHSFSKPYSLSKNKRLIFWRSDFYHVSHSIGVTFFSKEANNLFILDSSLTLYNSSIR